MLSIETNNEIWKNWSASVICETERFLRPKKLSELVQIVKEHHKQNRKIRVVGSGHSFTPLVATDETLISIEHLAGIDHVDKENDIVTAWAGTDLKTLGQLLWEHGYAMKNLGDINAQSVAGAVSTGTHGTGIELGIISTQIAGVTLLTASGELVEIDSETNTHWFDAVRVSLGMLGIIVKIKLYVDPAYQLTSKSTKTTLIECVANLEETKQSNRNFEFFWFPFTKTVQMKTANINTETLHKKYKPSFFKDILIENSLFKVLSEISRIIPPTAKLMSKISAIGVPVGEKKGDSHLVYATKRLVKFNEMEYSIPAEHMGEVINEIAETIEKRNFRVHFPVECRYAKQDDIWISPAYGRDSAFVAIHMYKGMKHEEFFAAMEEIFQKYDGRPHWGKMHTMSHENVVAAYPNLDKFLQVRQELDPNQMFVNDYLKELFGI